MRMGSLFQTVWQRYY